MPQIDQDPRHHSHLYEVKPMSRWWLVLVTALVVLGVFVNGVTNPGTWYLLMVGIFFGWAVVLTNPKKWLSRLD